MMNAARRGCHRKPSPPTPLTARPPRHPRALLPRGESRGGTDVTDPLAGIECFDPELARPGMRMLMTSASGEDAPCLEPHDGRGPIPARVPETLRRTIARTGENREPAMTSILFTAGAVGPLCA